MKYIKGSDVRDMKEYIVRYTEVLARTEKIEADTEEDAYNIARIRYNDEKVVLNADDLTDREIRVLKSGAGGSL